LLRRRADHQGLGARGDLTEDPHHVGSLWASAEREHARLGLRGLAIEDEHEPLFDLLLQFPVPLFLTLGAFGTVRGWVLLIGIFWRTVEDQFAEETVGFDREVGVSEAHRVRCGGAGKSGNEREEEQELGCAAFKVHDGRNTTPWPPLAPELPRVSPVEVSRRRQQPYPAPEPESPAVDPSDEVLKKGRQLVPTALG
jgi:hypothetical protein